MDEAERWGVQPRHRREGGLCDGPIHLRMCAVGGNVTLEDGAWMYPGLQSCCRPGARPSRLRLHSYPMSH